MSVRYFEWTMPEPPLLLRQVRNDIGLREEVFRDGSWQPTDLVNQWKAGRNDFVEEISDEQARELAPAAV